MSLFSLVETEEEKKNESVASKTQEEVTKVKEPQQQAGSPETLSQQSEKDQTQTGKEVIKEIHLKGPLGHAYTEALRLVLGKNSNTELGLRNENVYQAIQASILTENQESDNSLSENQKGYVYVYDGKKLGIGDVGEIFDQVTSKTNTAPQKGYLSVVVENPETVFRNEAMNMRLENLSSSLQAMGIPLYFTRDAAIGSIVGFLNTK